MTEAALTTKEQEVQRAEANELRRANYLGLWQSLQSEDPFAEFYYRRIFAMELLNSAAEHLHPRVGSFLGQTAVDRNAYSEKQKAYLTSLVTDHLERSATSEESKSKKKTEAGK